MTLGANIDELPPPRKRKLSERSPDVVKRWHRLKWHKRIQRNTRFIMRWVWFPISERKRRKALEETFEIVRRQTSKYEQGRYNSSLIVFNIALYLLIAERDLQAVKIDALTHPNPWTRNLFTRMILLTLHELDLDKVTGTQLRSALDEVGASETTRKEAQQALRAVRKVQEKARKKLGALRNSTIGHRDANALFQYESIRTLNTKEVFGLAIEFYAAAERFHSILSQIMREAGTMKALVWQVLNKARNSDESKI